MNCLKITCFLFVILLSYRDLFAQEKDFYCTKEFPLSRVRLTLFMSKHQVIHYCGTPLEKLEKETARRDIWNYKDKSIEFSEGRIYFLTEPSEVSSNDSYTTSQSESLRHKSLENSENYFKHYELSRNAESSGKTVQEQHDNQTIEKVIELNDVLKDLSSVDEKEKGGNASLNTQAIGPGLPLQGSPGNSLGNSVTSLPSS
jgi:hypothetical protein